MHDQSNDPRPEAAREPVKTAGDPSAPPVPPLPPHLVPPAPVDENRLAPAPMPVPGYGAYGQPRVNTYMVQAVLATLFCFMPLGLVAMVYAARVSAYLDNGDLVRASVASAEAKKWCWWSLAIGVAAVVLTVAFFFLMFAAAAGAGSAVYGHPRPY